MQDKIIKQNKWEFDNEVTNCFDNMLERSIPQYHIMRKLVFQLGEKFVKPNTNIIDLGASRGEAILPFINKFENNNKYKLFEISQSMLNILYKRYDNYIKKGIVNIKNFDIKNKFSEINSSLILSILTLQFTPIEYRQNIIQNIYDNLNENGAFILVEKVIGNTCDIDNIMVDLYYQLKKDNGYTQEQIERKKLSLEGVLVPITTNWNIELLKNVGFKKIDCFWRYLNFAGFIAIK